jgi:exodeoxyribonuclease VII small subunit
MDHTFETAFERLEQILAKMNMGKTPLDESIKMFEEADKLIRFCSGRLTSAEQKVEALIKGRNGELAVDGAGAPQTQPYPQNTSAGENACPF